jgi:hypothetical protein
LQPARLSQLGCAADNRIPQAGYDQSAGFVFGGKQAIQARSAMRLSARGLFKSPEASLHPLALTVEIDAAALDVARPVAMSKEQKGSERCYHVHSRC